MVSRVPPRLALRRFCRRRDRGFYFSTAFLPSAKRDAVLALGGFCRMIAAAFAPAANAQQTWLLFKSRLDELYARRLELPMPQFRTPEQHILAGVMEAVARYQIPRGLFEELADGCCAGLGTSRYATWAALEKFCGSTGGTAARILSCALGLQHSQASRQAGEMGVALQCTHLLGALKADAARGCIYLPLEDLAQFRYRQECLIAGRVNDEFRALMQFEIERVREIYRRGAQGICWLAGEGARLMAATLLLEGAALVGAVERRGFDVFTHAPRPTAGRWLARLPAAWRLARRPEGRPLPNVFG